MTLDKKFKVCYTLVSFINNPIGGWEVLKKLKSILKKIWSNKLAFVCLCVAVYFAAKFYCQKQETLIYKEKLAAVSALFKPTATTCPKVEAPECPPPTSDQQVATESHSKMERSPDRVLSRPKSPASQPAAKAEGNISERDRLLDLAEKALDDPALGTNQANPAINRRDGRGRLKSPSVQPKAGVKVRLPSWAE